MRKQKLSVIQKDLIIGSLLGDGYLMPTTCGRSFRAHHGIKQKDYLDWKYSILRNIVNTKPKRGNVNSYYFRTISHPELNRYRKLFYDTENRKILPNKLLRMLNLRSLAIWIMDDGSRDGRSLRINSQNFSYSEHIILKDILRNNFEVEANIHKDRHMFRLWIKAKDMDKLKKNIFPHIIPSMLYKLSP